MMMQKPHQEHMKARPDEEWGLMTPPAKEGMLIIREKHRLWAACSQDFLCFLSSYFEKWSAVQVDANFWLWPTYSDVPCVRIAPKTYHTEWLGLLNWSDHSLTRYLTRLLMIHVISAASGMLARMHSHTCQLKGCTITRHLSSFSSGFRMSTPPYSKKYSTKSMTVSRDAVTESDATARSTCCGWTISNK